jgi:hypothetical protein
MNTTTKGIGRMGPVGPIGRMLLGLMLAFCLGPGVWTAGAAVGVFPSLGNAGTNQITINNFAVNTQYVTNQYVNISYTTNLYVSVIQEDIAYVTNQYVSVSIVTNQYVTTNYVNTSFVTNFYSSTSFITNLNVNKLTVNNFTTMNTFFTTNAFPSATNTFDLTNTFQLLQTFTSASVTNIGSVSNNLVGQGLLIVSNASATNITLTITVPNATAVGAQSVASLTIAAGQMGWAKFLTYGNVFTNYADDTYTGTLLKSPVDLGSANASGTLAAGRFPALTGDITTSAGALATTLKNTGTAGTYRSATFDAQGRETSGSNPTTFSGYGISDSAANLFSALTTADFSSATNLTYKYTTNAVTALALTFGKSYFTNVSTANIVFTAINAQDLAATETCILRCTNSSGSDWTVTLPNGIGSPGLGLPPVITVTNKQSCRIYVEHYANQQTNAWFIATY